MISSVSFSGRTPATIERRKQTKEGLYRAEKLLRSAQNKYGKTNSGSYLQLKVINHKDNPKYSNISRKLTENSERYSEELMFQPYRKITRAYNTGKPVGEALLGDCGECAQAVQLEYLMQYDEKTINVVMDVKKANGGCCNHAFNLSNFEKGAKLDDPKTWGKQAIVTDLWSGIAMKSDDAINYFNQLFSVNPNTDKISFSAMPDSENSFQTAILKFYGMDEKSSLYNIPYSSCWE